MACKARAWTSNFATFEKPLRLAVQVRTDARGDQVPGSPYRKSLWDALRSIPAAAKAAFGDATVSARLTPRPFKPAAAAEAALLQIVEIQR